MKLGIVLLIALCLFATITIASANFERMNHFFEYLNPAWRLHRFVSLSFLS